MKPDTIIQDGPQSYTLLKYIGNGSYGEVWKARNNATNEDVAIKFYIPLDDRGQEEFRDEYEIASRVDHKNLLKVSYIGTWENRPFLVMRYCPEGSCDRLVGKLEPNAENEKIIWRFIRDVASGLAYLHSVKPDPIVHQDIKPGNILQDSDGSFVITDFGISTRIRATMRRQSGRTEGTGAVAYMGPERFSPQPAPVLASDIWSLGVSIYEMAMGELPFCGQGGIMLHNGADMPKVDNRWSKDLKKVIKKCLAKKPWERIKACDLVEYAQTQLDGKHTGKNRHRFVSFWLWLCTISAALAVIVFCARWFCSKDFFPMWIRIGFLVMTFIVLWGYLLLLRWKKSGFFLILGAQILTLLLGMFVGDGLLNPPLSVLSAVMGITVLYGVLHIKNTDGISYWKAMDEEVFVTGIWKKYKYVAWIGGVVAALCMFFSVYVGTSDRREARSHKMEYHQLVTECYDKIYRGNDSEYTYLLDAITQMDTIYELEKRYSKILPKVFNQSDSLAQRLTAKRIDACKAWTRAAKTQENLGEKTKALDYYMLADKLNPSGEPLLDFEFLAKSMGNIRISSLDFHVKDENDKIIESGDTLKVEDNQTLGAYFVAEIIGAINEWDTLEVKLAVKVFEPNGSLIQISGYPRGYTFDVTLRRTGIQREKRWIWEEFGGLYAKGGFPSGVYRYEIWYEKSKLFSKKLIIK